MAFVCDGGVKVVPAAEGQRFSVPLLFKPNALSFFDSSNDFERMTEMSGSAFVGPISPNRSDKRKVSSAVKDEIN